MSTIIVCDWCDYRSEDRSKFADINLTAEQVSERLHMCLECCPGFVSDSVLSDESVGSVRSEPVVNSDQEGETDD